MILAIDTTSEACSVALIDGEDPVTERHEIIGRGHAERLAPMIAELPNSGRADSILVDCGPGSFTGLRVGPGHGARLGFCLAGSGSWLLFSSSIGRNGLFG